MVIFISPLNLSFPKIIFYIPGSFAKGKHFFIMHHSVNFCDAEFNTQRTSASAFLATPVFQEVFNYSVGPGRGRLSQRSCPGQAAKEVSESGSAGNGFLPRDILRVRKRGLAQGMQ
jgi:hypothetical protein